MLSSKPKSILDTMASQTRSNLTIPDDPVIPLPCKSKKTKPKPASVSVIVETISTEGTNASALASNDAITMVGNSGEMFPASLEVAQVDITGDRAAVAFTSAHRTSNPIANADDNATDDAPVDMKPSPFDPTKDHDDDDDDDGDDPISNKQAFLDCSFLFESSLSCPGLADELNGSYDLSFRSDKLFTNPSVLTAGPT